MDNLARPAELEIALRRAAPADIPVLLALIERSVRGLQSADYTPAQIERALIAVYGIDTQLIADGTYFAVECAGAIVGCGGWSRRATLHGGDQWAERSDALLDPATDAAKIRAFYVDPRFARRGIGRRILAASERAARAAGFTRFEIGATLTGVALYLADGYAVVARVEISLGDGTTLPIVHMAKSVPVAG
jgi:GNAT superfamily N-acetyltransferase